MTKEEALFNQEYAYIFNWKQRIEAVSGLPCPHLSQLGKIFTAKELKSLRRRLDIFQRTY